MELLISYKHYEIDAEQRRRVGTVTLMINSPTVPQEVVVKIL